MFCFGFKASLSMQKRLPISRFAKTKHFMYSRAIKRGKRQPYKFRPRRRNFYKNLCYVCKEGIKKAQIIFEHLNRAPGTWLHVLFWHWQRCNVFLRYARKMGEKKNGCLFPVSPNTIILWSLKSHKTREKTAVKSCITSYFLMAMPVIMMSS